MDAVADANPRSNTCGFTEPNLEFRTLLSIKRPVLRVYFDLEARPSWASNGSAGKEDIWIEFPIEELDLRSAARHWRAELSAFPQRASR